MLGYVTMMGKLITSVMGVLGLGLKGQFLGLGLGLKESLRIIFKSLALALKVNSLDLALYLSPIMGVLGLGLKDSLRIIFNSLALALYLSPVKGVLGVGLEGKFLDLGLIPKSRVKGVLGLGLIPKSLLTSLVHIYIRMRPCHQAV